jgi:asparagine synthase (glutamine-hydrolysing)
VILKSYAEWGTKCFNRFNGMFSLAIYDYSKEKIIIARDRSGEKPLYYSKINGTIKFSSELKALFVDKDQKKILDINSLDMYLAWGYVPGEKSIIKGIK